MNNNEALRTFECEIIKFFISQEQFVPLQIDRQTTRNAEKIYAAFIKYLEYFSETQRYKAFEKPRKNLLLQIAHTR